MLSKLFHAFRVPTFRQIASPDPLPMGSGWPIPLQPDGEKPLAGPGALAYNPPAFLKMKRLLSCLLGILACAGSLPAQNSVFAGSEDFDRFARKLRESALSSIEPRVIVPTTSGFRGISGRYPWKMNVVTTVFWAGESATQNNPVHNRSSSWDANWAYNFGGFDNPDPSQRQNFMPINFVPNENPFYFALPYNDVSGGRHKPEARTVIPWFAQVFERDGKSVCHNRWIAIRKGNRVCYAQWSDCGPFSTDHWEYVFGNQMPAPNRNRGAGLDVSPSVRDYLGMGSMDVVDWKFVEARDVPVGPWARIGSNNTVLARLQRTNQTVVNAAPALKAATKSKANIAADAPTVVNQ